MIKAIALENVWLNFSDETKAAFKKNKAYQFQFKKEEDVAYETARTSMDFLADSGFYKKSQIRNKFVYTPIPRR